MILGSLIVLIPLEELAGVKVASRCSLPALHGSRFDGAGGTRLPFTAKLLLFGRRMLLGVRLLLI